MLIHSQAEGLRQRIERHGISPFRTNILNKQNPAAQTSGVSQNMQLATLKIEGPIALRHGFSTGLPIFKSKQNNYIPIIHHKPHFVKGVFDFFHI